MPGGMELPKALVLPGEMRLCYVSCVLARTICVLLGISLLLCPAQAEKQTAHLMIQVNDIASSRIPKAHVEILDMSTTLTKKLDTDDDGKVAIDLPFGTYEVTASYPAFRTEKKKIEVITANQTVTFMLDVLSGGGVEVVPPPSGSEPTYTTLPDKLLDVSNVNNTFCSPCPGVPRSSTQLKLDAGPFSILAPLGWEFHQLMGVDSFVGEFVGDGVVLRFDFGQQSHRYLKKYKKPAYVIGNEGIGGFSAKIASPATPGHGLTGVYFRNVGHSNGLFLWGQDLTSPQEELVLRIFRTIRFGGPIPRYLIPPPPASKRSNGSDSGE